MKLHLGCGEVHLSGFVNVDNRDLSTVDIVDDVRYMAQFSNSCASEIYACHILEHFNRHIIPKVLLRWYEVLKPSGVLNISVPDFDAIVKQYQCNRNLYELIGLLYGGQTYGHNSHHYCWNFDTIKDDLLSAGFNEVSRYDWHKSDFAHFDDYSKAYLPHMDQSGRLMSLNVKAIK